MIKSKLNKRQTKWRDILLDHSFYCNSYEQDNIDHVVYINGDFYDFCIQYMINNNIKNVVDIGCSCGHQSEAFIQEELNYEGVEKYPFNMWKSDLVKYHIGAYPFEFNTKAKLAISNLCYGYFIHDYEVLSNQFDTVILNNIKDKKEIEKYFNIKKELHFDFETECINVPVYILTKK